MTDTTQTAIFGATSPAKPGLWSLLSATVLSRAAAIALGLGSVLTLVNQSDALFGAEQLRLLPLMLNYATPFVVVIASQLLGARQAILDRRRGAWSDPAQETFLATVMKHDIPSRALRLGLLAGAVNTILIVTGALIESDDLSALPWAPLAQALTLPVLFGVLSQAVAYRRASRHMPLG